MFLDSSGFPFCLDWNLVQCLFTSLCGLFCGGGYMRLRVLHYVDYIYVYVVMGFFVRTSFSAVVNLLLLRLTIVSVMLDC